MKKSRINPKVDKFLKEAEKWREEMEKLRAIVLDFELTEELKWGKPCYSFEGKNVVIIIPFKESCALMFCKGALLKDPNGILIRPTQNTQATKWVKFSNVREIARMKSILKAYIGEAIEAEKAGLKVTYKKTEDYAMPEEFQKKLDAMPALKTAFEALTPGRQRGYLLHFAAPKQSKTRESRIEKCMDLIFDGKGLNEDYKSVKK